MRFDAFFEGRRAEVITTRRCLRRPRWDTACRVRPPVGCNIPRWLCATVFADGCGICERLRYLRTVAVFADGCGICGRLRYLRTVAVFADGCGICGHGTPCPYGSATPTPFHYTPSATISNGKHRFDALSDDLKWQTSFCAAFGLFEIVKIRFDAAFGLFEIVENRFDAAFGLFEIVENRFDAAFAYLRSSKIVLMRSLVYLRSSKIVLMRPLVYLRSSKIVFCGLWSI